MGCSQAPSSTALGVGVKMVGWAAGPSVRSGQACAARQSWFQWTHTLGLSAADKA